MREVRVVGIDAEGTRLLLDEVQPSAPVFSARPARPSGASDHHLPIDARLRAFVRRGLARQSGEPWLTPREVQARLRAGESVEAVAAAAGMPIERMEAYAAPVLSERVKVLADAQAAVMSRPHRGPSVLTLGASVACRLPDFADPGSGTGWFVRREPDGAWTVELQYRRNGRDRTARWRWDRFLRSLAPEDADAAALGHVSAEEVDVLGRLVAGSSRRAARSTGLKGPTPAVPGATLGLTEAATAAADGTTGPGGVTPASAGGNGPFESATAVPSTAVPSTAAAPAQVPAIPAERPSGDIDEPGAVAAVGAADVAAVAGTTDASTEDADGSIAATAGTGATARSAADRSQRRPPHAWADVLLGVGPRTPADGGGAAEHADAEGDPTGGGAEAAGGADPRADVG